MPGAGVRTAPVEIPNAGTPVSAIEASGTWREYAVHEPPTEISIVHAQAVHKARRR